MTPQGAAVSNSFRVTNGEVFLGEIATLFPNVVVESTTDEVGDVELMPGETRVELYAEDGYWPVESETYHGERPVEFFGFISNYIASNDMAILHSVSFQGPGDVRFQSVSIKEFGKIESIELPQVEALHHLIHSMPRK